MKLLRVLVLVHNSPAALRRETRPVGFWSYDVPEFTWDIRYPGKGALIDTHLKGFDLIWEEDGASWPEYKRGGVPVIGYYIDSTLSYENHLLPRQKQARQVDLILVDHDDLHRFQGLGHPVRRILHCVNDHIFRDYWLDRTVDISFHCGSGGSEIRKTIRRSLHELCLTHGWTYASGVRELTEYAKAMNRSKIVVNVPRCSGNRPHRIFDALACNTCLMTEGMHVGEAFGTLQFDRDFLQWQSLDQLETLLVQYLNGDQWKELAWAGFERVHMEHTWKARAPELRQLLWEELHV